MDSSTTSSRASSVRPPARELNGVRFQRFHASTREEQTSEEKDVEEEGEEDASQFEIGQVRRP
jgi:hypothetical protein